MDKKQNSATNQETGIGYDSGPPIEIKKWGYKSQLLPSYYFQPQPGIDSSILRMTNVSVYSTTPWKEANCISRTILNFYKGGSQNHKLKTPLKPIQKEETLITPFQSVMDGGSGAQSPPLIVTDGTANIGGNTISFYLNGIFQVNAVEMDDLTCQILKHNLEVYKLPTNTVYCCDYLSIYKKLEQDVVFLDPPWGGPDYKKASLIDLYLGGNSSEKSLTINIIDICAELMEEKKTTLIVLKLPLNYNLPGLIARMPNKNFLTQKIYRKKKHSYNVIFCW